MAVLSVRLEYRAVKYFRERWIAILALLLSIASLIVSLQAGKRDERNQVEASLREYLSAFDRIVPNLPEDSMSIEVFDKLGPLKKLQATIVIGMLIEVVDSMEIANDPRAADWAGYIRQFPGPIACYRALSGYSRTQRTRDLIASERLRLRTANITCSDG